MLVVYENKNDSMKLHYGELVTSVSKIENAIYLDIVPNGHVKTKQLDYKNLHIQSVPMEHVKAFADTHKSIKENFSEEFI